MCKELKMENKNYTQCVACLSKDITFENRIKRVDVPFAGYITYNTMIAHCNSCNTDIRLGSDSQEEVEKQILEASINSIPGLLIDLNRRGYSDDRLERCFNLGKGKIKKWKDREELQPEDIALIRLLYMLPELIKVAENGYEIPVSLGKIL